MKHAIWLCAAMLALAGCGDGEDAAQTELPDPRAAAAPDLEAGAEPARAEAAPDQRAALIEACLGIEGNSQAACECAADESAARMDQASYDYFVAELSGSGEAESLRGELGFTQMIDTVEAIAKIGETCDLALPEL